MTDPPSRTARNRGPCRCAALLTVALLSMSPASLPGQSPRSAAVLPPLADGTMALVGVRVISMSEADGSATGAVTLVIRDGLIAGIGSPDSVAGLTPYEALLTATVGPATFLGIDGHVGTVEVGKRADLLLLAGNPLDDLSVLREPVAVILRGRIVAAD